MILDPIQIRVLGALVEKEITTPENYPLSLNALIAACNQRSSREPVLDLGEDEVRQAVHSLEDVELVAAVRDSRVPKYENRIRTVLNLRRDETAVLCLLMLRGPQTPGELRGRADRMYSFDDIAAVQSTLERLAGREPGALAVQLARQPGSRESRHAQLLGGPVAGVQGHGASVGDRGAGDVAATGGGRVSMAERVEALEAAIEALAEEHEVMRVRLERLEAANGTGPARVDRTEA